MLRQAPVPRSEATDPETALEPEAQGWYYDDFSEYRSLSCHPGSTGSANAQQISFKLTEGWNEDGDRLRPDYAG